MLPSTGHVAGAAQSCKNGSRRRPRAVASGVYDGLEEEVVVREEEAKVWYRCTWKWWKRPQVPLEHEHGMAG